MSHVSIFNAYADCTRNDPLLTGISMLRELQEKMNETLDSGVLEIFELNHPDSPKFARNHLYAQRGVFCIYHAFGDFTDQYGRPELKCKPQGKFLFENNRDLSEKTAYELFAKTERDRIHHTGFSRASLILGLDKNDKIFLNYSNHDPKHIFPNVTLVYSNHQYDDVNGDLLSREASSRTQYDQVRSLDLSIYAEKPDDLVSFFNKNIVEFMHKVLVNDPVCRNIEEPIIKETQEKHPLFPSHSAFVCP